MTEVFQYLRNWFDRNQPKYYGKFTIENGALVGDYKIATGQFYRIMGSALNDGVYKYGSEEELDDEVFEGAIWLMAVPKDVRNLIAEIDMWQEKYGGIDSANMSPYQSESFGGYSYSKASGGSTSSSSVPTWQAVFADRLGRYKKL
jgi:hypothetical protein